MKRLIRSTKSDIHGEGTFAMVDIKAFTRVPLKTGWLRRGLDAPSGMNHSCTYNCRNDPDDPWSVIALEDIARGEELTVEYDIDHPLGTICRCPQCRLRGP